MIIKIQKNDFNLDSEIKLIKSKHPNVGAVSNFIGYVRNNNNNKIVKSIEIEVYKEMAEKSLYKICKNAKENWDLIDTLVIHRFGNLQINDKIVLVATFAPHRKDSIESCNYIMDYLKKDSPFWKKEQYKKNFAWL